MDAQSARQILLIRAIEESDSDYTILDRAARVRATAKARNESSSDEAILAQRAAILSARLLDTHPRLRPMSQGLGFGAAFWLIIPGVVIVWLLISGVTKGFWAEDQSINVLVVPLLVLFVWNLVCISVKIGTLIWSRIFRNAAPRSLLDRLSGLLGEQQLRFVERLTRNLNTHSDQDLRLWRSVFGKFGSSWFQLSRSLYDARLRFSLHIAACALVAGEFAYVYIKGIAVEFQATWESTWFSAEITHDILTTMLWPAWSLMGERLPSANAIAELKTQPTNAAFWINLYLVQACILVFIPRFILMTSEWFRGRRLERSFSLPLTTDHYYQNLLYADRGKSVVARVVPYSFQPSPKTRDTIHHLLSDELGGSASVDFESTVQYGEMTCLTDRSTEVADPSWHWVLLFNFAQTPENEVHGSFIASVTQSMTDRSNGDQMAIVIDACPYRERLAGEPELDIRLNERRIAWENLANEQGLNVFFLGLEHDANGLANRTIPWHPRNGE